MKNTLLIVLVGLALGMTACSAKNLQLKDNASINVPIGNGTSSAGEGNLVEVPAYPQVACGQNPPPELVGIGVQVLPLEGWGDMYKEFIDHGVYNNLRELFDDAEGHYALCGVNVFTAVGQFNYSNVCFSPMPPAMQVNVLQANFCCVDGFWSHQCAQ